MADQELGELPAAGALDGTVLLYIVDQDGNSRRVTLAELKTFVNTDPTIVPSSEPWRGARVRRSSNVTGITWPYIVSWNSEVEDTHGFWSAGAPTRLTVPAGVTRVRLRANVEIEGSANTGSMFLSILKNGAAFNGQGAIGNRNSSTGFSSNVLHCHSWSDQCTNGDYYEVRINVNTLTGVDEVVAGTLTWFELEVVEHS